MSSEYGYSPLVDSVTGQTIGAPSLGIMEGQKQEKKKYSVLDQADTLREQRIDWSTFKTMKLVSEQELPLLKQYTSQPENREDLLAQHGPFYMRMFKNLLANLSSLDMLKQIITLLTDILDQDPSNLQLLEEEDSDAEPAWAVFAKHLSLPGSDPYLRHRASSILSQLVAKGYANDMDDVTRKRYLVWLRSVLEEKIEDTTTLALTSLMRLLRNEEFRIAFFTGGVDCLVISLCVKSFGVQVQYQALFCLWILSFSPRHASSMETTGRPTIPAVADVLRGAMKDKLKRVALAYLRNIVEKVEDQSVRYRHTSAMITYKLLPCIERMALHKAVDDEEGVADATYLLEILKETYEHMSSFDEYAAEVLSGSLDWSPVHRSERFWRENFMRLNEDKHKLLKVLVEILSQSKDKLSLAVGAHDLGEYCRHYARGRQVLDQLGGKELIMGLTGHDDANVRYESLLCLQKMMTSNWEYLGEKLKAGAENE